MVVVVASFKVVTVDVSGLLAVVATTTLVKSSVVTVSVVVVPPSAVPFTEPRMVRCPNW